MTTYLYKQAAEDYAKQLRRDGFYVAFRTGFFEGTWQLVVREKKSKSLIAELVNKADAEAFTASQST